MSGLIRGIIVTAGVALATCVVALAALAGPGDGSAVVIDSPDAPEIVIREVRIENTDATHVPVKIRITVPNHLDGETPLQSALVTLYLTTTTDPESERVSEVSLRLGSEWANRSLVVEVPSPGEGSYFAHVDADMWLDDDTHLELASTSTQRLSFGKTKNCTKVVAVPIFGGDEQSCPVLFDTKSGVFKPTKSSALGTSNQKVLDTAVDKLDELCASDSLHRVSVHGWASTLNSFDPPNEVLARSRAAAMVEALKSQVQGCADRIYDDSEPGTRAVTEKFGKGDENRHLNQCAQVQITSHQCLE